MTLQLSTFATQSVTCGRRYGKNFLTLLQHWSGAVTCPAVDAARMAGGPNALRGSGPLAPRVTEKRTRFRPREGIEIGSGAVIEAPKLGASNQQGEDETVVVSFAGSQCEVHRQSIGIDDGMHPSGLKSGAMLLGDRGFDADWIGAVVSKQCVTTY